MLYRLPQILVLLAALGLSACAKPQVARGINDPNEQRNRAVHNFNKKIDSTVLRPVSGGYGTAIPKQVRGGVGNFSDNLSTPGYFVNDVLQGNIHDASSNFLRFLVNSTFGFAGLLDVAGDLGIQERSSDFGETLYVWGVGEGRYVELPLLGPSTSRAAVGKVVDLFTNPVGYYLPKPERYAMPVVGSLAGIDARYQYGDLVDSILYDSADSYAQARLLYLERRRFELQGSAPVDDGVFDPNANPFAEYE